MKYIGVIATSRSGHNWTTKFIRSWMNGDTVMQFENVLPKEWDGKRRQRLYKGQPPPEGSTTIAICQIRDYLNFSASWIKYLIERGNAYRSSKVVPLFDKWLAIAQEGISDTSFIFGKITLYYDLFVQDEAYRRQICGLLGGDYNESELNHVPKGGMGSSFDKFQYQENGSEMKVIERWKWFNTEEGSYYIRYLKQRPQIVEYYASKFDLEPGKIELVDEILK